MAIILQPGSTFDKNYEVISFVGSGGMGSVYKAKQKGLERIVALKLLKIDQLNVEENVSRFEREAKSLSKLLNKHIARFYSYGRDERGLHYIAMEYLEGKSLRQLLNEEETLNWKRAINISKQICSAMASAHEQGTINRDLKPENIILQKEHNNDLVKIIDFGLAKLISENEQRTEETLTRTGELVGTVHYLSPEQCKGRAADARSDIYALGCILYEMLVGRPPFEADNPIGILHKHSSEELSFPENSNIDADLRKIILRATSKLPEGRYQSMLKLQDDLEHLESGRRELITAGDEIDPASAKRVKTNYRNTQILIAAFALVASASALFLWFINSDEAKVARAKTALAEGKEKDPEIWMAESDRLYSIRKEALSERLIESIKYSRDKEDPLDFFDLELEHAEKLLRSGDRTGASRWAWRCITGIERDSSAKSESIRDRYNLQLNRACKIVLETGIAATKAQSRVFHAIIQDRTGKYRHYSDNKSVVALLAILTLQSSSIPSYEESEALFYYAQNTARQGPIDNAIRLLPSITKKLSARYEPQLALAGLCRMYFILAEEAEIAGNEKVYLDFTRKAEATLAKLDTPDSSVAEKDLCNLYMQLAQSQLKRGDAEAAERTERKALTYAYNNAQKAISRNNLAKFVLEKKNWNEAIAIEKEALLLTENTDDPGTLSAGVTSRRLLADALDHVGRVDEALVEFGKYIDQLKEYNGEKYAPYLFSVYLERAKFACAHGKHKLAQSDFESAAKLIDEQRLAPDSKIGLLKEQFRCALSQGDASKLEALIHSFQARMNERMRIVNIVDPDKFRWLRKTHPEIATQLIGLLNQSQEKFADNAGTYALEYKRLVTLLLCAGEWDAAREVVNKVLNSGRAFESNGEWFERKAQLLKNPEKSKALLLEDLERSEN